MTPEEFAAAMTRRWHSLGNISSNKLQQLWAKMAATFGRAAADDHNVNTTTWRVLEPPTGTGKTQGLSVYAALTIAKNRVSPSPLGILVVTRTIAQAEEIVATIRELLHDPADAARVQTRHSETKLNVFEMHSADVLVITHAAYTRDLEGLNQDRHGRWHDCTNWDHGPRRLTIIDEALSGIVEENQIKAEDIRVVLGFIDPLLKIRLSTQVAALEKVRDVLDKITLLNDRGDDGASTNHARVVWRSVHDGRMKFPQAFAMGPLREVMATIRYDLIALRKESTYDRQRIATNVDNTLKNCEAIMARWAYYYRKGNDDTFNSSQLLIPRGLRGPVVLDATASQNFLWKLLGSRAEIAEVPTGTRTYANVTIHVARASALGKGKMKERGKVRLPRLLANLEQTLTPDRKVLLCLHKQVEHIARTYKHRNSRSTRWRIGVPSTAGMTGTSTTLW